MVVLFLPAILSRSVTIMCRIVESKTPSGPN
jgi:hypothetical protein